MATSVSSFLTRTSVFIVLLLLSVRGVDESETNKQVEAILKQQRESKTGYVTLGSKEFDALVDGVSRPFAVYVFADALKYRNSKQLSLEKRLKEYGIVGRTYVKTHKGTEFEDKVVFARVTLEDGKEVFSRLGARGLPYLSYIPGNMEISPGKSINLPHKNLMAPAPVEEWGAQAIATFVAGTCGISPGDLSAELSARSPFLPVFVLIFLASVSIIGYKISQSPLIQWMPLYIVGSLFVFWFSLSGGMFNIIRGVPMVGMDPRTRQAKAFLQGSGQMGAEGFIMGSLVMVFGLLVAAATLLVPQIENSKARRRVSYGIMLAGYFVFNWVCGTHVWKTGMRTSFYF